MTTDPDKQLAQAIEGITACAAGGSIIGSYPIVALADVLAATRRELREARERIAIMTPAITDLRCDVEAMRTRLDKEDEAERAFVESIRVVEQPPDPRPLGVRVGLKHGPGGSGLAGPCDPDCAKCQAEGTPAPGGARWIPTCDDCGNSRWIPIGSRRCLKCQERDKLRAALAEACELLDPHARSDADRERIAELRRLL